MDKCIIQYKRTYTNKLKVKLTPPPEQNHDQGAEKFDANMEERFEGGPSTRLMPRKINQPPKKDPKHVTHKVEEKR